MNFQFSTDQLALEDTARRFAQEKLKPYAAAWDRDEYFPIPVLADAAKCGFAGIYIPESLGGSGLSRQDGAIIFAALAEGCISSAAYLTVHNMVAWAINEYATTEIKKKFLPKMMSMESLGSYCLTEAGSGSDAAALKTTAKKDSNGFIIDGNKTFITAGGVSDVYIVMARTGGQGADGISAFLVEKDSPGVSFGKKEQKMGWRSQPTTTVNFDSVRVPHAQMLGAEGEGFKIAMRALDGGRVNIAACSLGGAKAALDLAANYMHQRAQFGKKLTEFQSLQFKIANMAIQLDAARLLTFRAAASLDAKNPDAGLHCAMAKKFASDAAFQIADEALQLHGGYGYIADYEIERIFRDLRVHRILEGTNEIMQMIISRKVLGAYAP